MDRRRFLLSTAAVLAATVAPTEAFAAKKRKRRRKQWQPPKPTPRLPRNSGEIMDDIGPFVKKLRESHGLTDDAYALIVDPGRQEMHLVKGQMVEHTYVISTSRLGLGNTHHSYRTPWGTHRISLKIGAGAKRGAIFRHKKPTGGVANVTSGLHSRFHMTSRLLCLDGQEEGVNKGIHKGVTIDSFIRCIYIHGINAEGWIGRPCSGGCVVMTNDDVIELFDKVPEGTLVEILKREYKQT